MLQTGIISQSMMIPNISVIIPCYNEQDTITLLLDAIYQQTYPKENIEVLVIDGLSTDGTRVSIVKFMETHPDILIKTIDNPERIIPVALNKGIKAASGEIIIRLDAHSIPQRDYLERCVCALQDNKAENVGGIWVIKPGADNWIARGIARAASHPLGVGDARYRVGGEAQYVETVPFGSFYKSLFNRVGYFNENLLTNEDYEFNQRIRQSGGKIWFDPSIKSIYFARKTYGELAKQYWRYGYWKAKMLLQNPHSLRWRQAVPPLFVISILLGIILSIFYQETLILVIGELTVYLGILILVAAREAKKTHDFSLIFGMPIAMMIMHVCWGISFLWSMFTNYGKSTD